jgi:heme/copper-type cytochrome/quinol oxidase subunit 2
MVFVEFLNPGCYSQLYMIESKMKALKCGFFEGVYWSVLVSFMLTIVAFRMIIGHKKIDIEPEIIKNYALIMISIIFILMTSFYSIGYVNKWNTYQELIQKYKKQGLRDYEIFYLLEMEIGRSSAPYASALASTTGLLFLGPKGEKKGEKEKTEEENKEENKEKFQKILY